MARVSAPLPLVRRAGANLAQGAANITANPLRSALGALAIAAAVATIVGVSMTLDAVRRYAEVTTARTFGSDTFLIAQVAAPGRIPRRQLREQLARNPPIRRAEFSFLTRHAGDRVIYAPNAQARADAARGSLTIADAAITGTTASLAQIRDLNLAAGHFFDLTHERDGALVAVIGADIDAALFPDGGAVGQSIRVAGRRFQIIGVQARVGSGGLDKYAWIPLRAFERLFGAPRSLQIFAKPLGDESPVAAEDHARISLRAARRLQPGEGDSFDVLAPEAARGFVANLSSRIGAAALPISLMALAAAIVVVTNTILVSVTQRTREIGVRRALGARRDDIAREVLAESLLLSLGGGLAGVTAVVALGGALSPLAPIPLVVPPQSLVMAVIGTLGSAVLAGWYPARRANRLDVIAAIRAD